MEYQFKQCFCNMLLQGVLLFRYPNFTVRRKALERMLLMSKKAVPLHTS